MWVQLSFSVPLLHSNNETVNRGGETFKEFLVYYKLPLTFLLYMVRRRRLVIGDGISTTRIFLRIYNFLMESNFKIMCECSYFLFIDSMTYALFIYKLHTTVIWRFEVAAFRFHVISLIDPYGKSTNIVDYFLKLQVYSAWIIYSNLSNYRFVAIQSFFSYAIFMNPR